MSLWRKKQTVSELDFDSMTMEGQEALRYNSDTKERHSFSCWVRWINSAYLFAGVAVMVADGAQWIQLSDGVIITMLGTTTLNVLGLAFIILHGLFDKEKKQ